MNDGKQKILTVQTNKLVGGNENVELVSLWRFLHFLLVLLLLLIFFVPLLFLVLILFPFTLPFLFLLILLFFSVLHFKGLEFLGCKVKLGLSNNFA